MGHCQFLFLMTFFFMWAFGHDYVFVLCDEIDLSCMMVLEFYCRIGNGFVFISISSNVWTLNILMWCSLQFIEELDLLQL